MFVHPVVTRTIYRSRNRGTRTTASYLFFFKSTSSTEIYTLSLHDALPISGQLCMLDDHGRVVLDGVEILLLRSEEHTSELQSPDHLVCRLLLEKKKAERAIQPLVLSEGDFREIVTGGGRPYRHVVAGVVSE